jgi:RHS repeat-associated protein
VRFDGNLFFYHTDNQDSIIAHTNDNGDLCDSIQYGGYGAAVVVSTQGAKLATPVSGDNLSYLGLPLDVEVWSNHFGRRNYDSRSGRFESEDPAREYKRGLATASSGVSTYVYARDNPINFSDPLGTSPVPNIPPISVPPLESAKREHWGPGIMCPKPGSNDDSKMGHPNEGGEICKLSSILSWALNECVYWCPSFPQLDMPGNLLQGQNTSDCPQMEYRYK